jgi:hypothetical protein
MIASVVAERIAVDVLATVLSAQCQSQSLSVGLGVVLFPILRLTPLKQAEQAHLSSDNGGVDTRDGALHNAACY